MSERRTPRFEIDAGVVRALGDELITDEVQALLELAKNSYDADASWVLVSVSPSAAVGAADSFYPGAIGHILVQDDGHGMDWGDIERGWLTIAASPKRLMKAAGMTTKKGRTPLGDKGLGRLGVMRLGRYLEIWTGHASEQETHHLGIDWDQFRDVHLSRIEPRYVNSRRQEKPGTRVLVGGLRSPQLWQDRQSRERLVGGLAMLLSPFPELRQFEVILEIDGQKQSLDTGSEQLLRLANQEIEFVFDGDRLAITWSYALAFARDQRGGRHAEPYERYIVPDQGADFYAYLTQSGEQRSHGGPSRFALSSDSRWYLTSSQTISLKDIAALDVVAEGVTLPANPGPFRGLICAFPRRGIDPAFAELFGGRGELGRLLDNHAGVRVYRDGFGIRPFGESGNDWLNLRESWTSGTSWYGLRPNNVIGYVALSARDNPVLRETTSREGFIDDAYSRTFLGLMDRLVSETYSRNEAIRRGLVDYNQVRRGVGDPFSGAGTQEIVDELSDVTSSAQMVSAQMPAARKRLSQAQALISISIRPDGKAPQSETLAGAVPLPSLAAVSAALGEAQEELDAADSVLARLAGVSGAVDRLEADLDLLRDQLSMWSELAALGMTAEALSHEIATIADSLAQRTAAFLRSKQLNSDSRRVALEYGEHVRSAIARIRKQLSHLDPALRYVREERGRLAMKEYLHGLCEFHGDRLGRLGIHVGLLEPFQDFAIVINKGKLTQVVDNLVLNAEYWLTQALRTGEITDARILFRSVPPAIDVLDTGRGVDPSVEHHLFQPFATTKPRGVGRGLGLYISRQLLATSGCTISLLPERNAHGRRHVFRIDLSGALDNG